MATTYLSENFDGLTPPALPTGWSSVPAGAATSSASAASSGTNSLKISASGAYVFAFDPAAVDSNHGLTRISAKFKLENAATNFVDPTLYLRTQAAPVSSAQPDGYMFTVGMYDGDGGLILKHNHGGTSDAIRTVKPASYGSLWSASEWYTIEFSADDTLDRNAVKLEGWISRSSDGAYLRPDGTWLAGRTPTIAALWAQTVADRYKSGFAMVGGYSSSGNAFYIDDVLFDDTSPPAGPDPATPPTSGDEVEYLGTAISGDSGASTASVTDGDFDTAYVSGGQWEGWIGLDLGSGAASTLSRVLYAPGTDRGGLPNDGREATVPGMIAEGTDSTSGPWEYLGTIDRSTYPFRYYLNELATLAGSAHRYFRLRCGHTYCQMAELRFQGSRGTGLSWRPARPVITPAAGRYDAGTPITLTTPTAGAAIYYTTDGTDPTTDSTLYSGPIPLPPIVSGVTLTLKAIAYHADGSAATSAVSTGYFNPSEYVPDTGVTRFGTSNTWPQDWYDTLGRLIEAHTGGTLDDTAGSGKTWLVGGFFNTSTQSDDVLTRGYWFYSTGDNLNWICEGMLIPPAPAWFVADDGTYMSSQTRPHPLINPSPIDPDKKYVCWSHVDDRLFVSGYAGVATAPAMGGPWTWRGFAKINGLVTRDGTAFLDPTDGSAYYIADTGDHANLTAARLDPATDWTTFDGTFITLDSTGSREAPILFWFDGYYYLITSNTTPYGSGNSQVKYKSATTLAGLNAATYSTIYSSAPAIGSVAYNAQCTAVSSIAGRGGLIYQADVVDPGEVPFELYHCRQVWYPIPPGSIGGGSLAIEAPNAWTLASLPALSPPNVANFAAGVGVGGRMPKNYAC